MIKFLLLIMIFGLFFHCTSNNVSADEPDLKAGNEDIELKIIFAGLSQSPTGVEVTVYTTNMVETKFEFSINNNGIIDTIFRVQTNPDFIPSMISYRCIRDSIVLGSNSHKITAQEKVVKSIPDNTPTLFNAGADTIIKAGDRYIYQISYEDDSPSVEMFYDYQGTGEYGSDNLHAYEHKGTFTSIVKAYDGYHTIYDTVMIVVEEYEYVAGTSLISSSNTLPSALSSSHTSSIEMTDTISNNEVRQNISSAQTLKELPSSSLNQESSIDASTVLSSSGISSESVLSSSATNSIRDTFKHAIDIVEIKNVTIYDEIEFSFKNSIEDSAIGAIVSQSWTIDGLTFSQFNEAPFLFTVGVDSLQNDIVTLTVTYSTGVTRTDTTHLTVYRDLPTLEFYTSHDTLEINQEIGFYIKSRDSLGVITSKVLIDHFGGVAHDLAISESSYILSGRSLPGKYSYTLTIEDDDGNAVSMRDTVVIVEPDPAEVILNAEIGGETTPSTGIYYLKFGDDILISATPHSGYRFKEWVILGDCNYTSLQNTAIILSNCLLGSELTPVWESLGGSLLDSIDLGGSGFTNVEELHYNGKQFVYVNQPFSSPYNSTVFEVIAGKLYETYSGNWSGGWNLAKSYTINNLGFLYIMKSNSGEVYMHSVDDSGVITLPLIDSYDWTSGWEDVLFYTVKGKIFIHLLKPETGQYSIGEINSSVAPYGNLLSPGEIHGGSYTVSWDLSATTIVGDSTYIVLMDTVLGACVVKSVELDGLPNVTNKQTLTYAGGWTKIEYFIYNLQQYLYFENAVSGKIIIHSVNANGTIGAEVVNKIKTDIIGGSFSFGNDYLFRVRNNELKLYSIEVLFE
ncbi:MAG: hypothetical protein OCC49_20045 [Fibrobacterales bacterium]